MPASHIVEAVNNDESFANLATAHVSYTTSNPNVATVSPTGTVTMTAAGTATISVTVNGVTGSTPIAVRYPLTATPPAFIAAGATGTATTAFTNPGSHPVSNVTMALTGPDGWKVTPATPASFATVPAGQTVQTSWHVTVPAGARPGSYELDAGAAFTDINGQGSSSTAASGSGTTLGFLGAADNATTASGTGTITYADGSIQQFTLAFHDWAANTAPPGGDILASFPFVNYPNAAGQRAEPVSIYYAAVPLQQGKTVAAVTLPNISQTAAQGAPAMHLFAAAIG